MIYLDNAATTKVYNDIIHLINYYNEEMFFNPSASYKKAVKIHSDIEDSRSVVADILGAKANEITFTSCGSESNNMAIFGASKNKIKKCVTCESEHLATYNCFMALKNHGYNIDITKANINAGIDVESMLSTIDSNTQLVSIMHVNNETGYINDVKYIRKEIKKINKNCIVHVDGVQAFCKLNIDVSDMDIDAYSFSGHKIGAPKGIGGIYIKSGVNIHPLIYGGGQERSNRSGTQNVAGIVALKEAALITIKNKFNPHETKKYMCKEIQNGVKDITLNSPFETCSDYILNVSIKSIKSEILQNYLQDDDIFIGLGSACSSRSRNDRVSKILSLGKDYTDGTIRISFFEHISNDKIKLACEKICNYVNKIREIG